MLTLRLAGVAEARTALDALASAVTAVTRTAGEAAAEATLPMIENHMHGVAPPKPGGEPPQRITGNLIGSLTHEPLGEWGQKVYPDGGKAPYARRIELGFTGVDSIGRKYCADNSQPPYPYFQPGWKDATPVIGRVYRDAWAEALT